jgi:hypothetical protein
LKIFIDIFNFIYIINNINTGGEMSGLLITCALLLLSVTVAGAETLKLSLRDAMSMALENNSQRQGTPCQVDGFIT